MAKQQRYLKNMKTGVVWPWTPVMAGEPIKLGKDQQGKPVKAVIFQRQKDSDGEMLKGHQDMVEISEEEAMAILAKKLPVPKDENEPESEKPKVLTKEGRNAAIEDAIASLPPEGWSKGDYPFPLVPAVSEIVGFKVAFQEIKTAWTAMKKDLPAVEVKYDCSATTDHPSG